MKIDNYEGGHIIFNEWMHSLAERGESPLSESSSKVYQSMWLKFCDYLSKHQRHPLNADASLVAHFSEGISAGIRQRYLQLLNRIYEWLKGLSKIGHNPALNPMKAYRPASLKRPAPSAMPKHLLQRFLAALPPTEGGRFDIRDRAMMMTILGSGIKVSELVKLKIGDVAINQSPPYLFIVATGLNNERLAPLAKIAHADMNTWISLLDGDLEDLLFPGEGGERNMSASTVYRRVSAIAKKAQIEMRHIGPMMLRHTFAVRQVVEERPLPVLQQWLGHHQIRSTEIYKQLIVNPGGWEPA